MGFFEVVQWCFSLVMAILMLELTIEGFSFPLISIPALGVIIKVIVMLMNKDKEVKG